MNIKGTLLKLTNAKHHELTIINRFLILTQAMLTAKITENDLTCIRIDTMIVSCGIASYLHTDNGKPFSSKTFRTLRTLLSAKHMKPMVYHSHTNGQVERYNKTSITCLHHYVATDHRNSDLFVEPMTFAYNTHFKQSSNTSPFSLVFTRHLPGPTSFDNPEASATDAYNATDARVLQR